MTDSASVHKLSAVVLNYRTPERTARAVGCLSDAAGGLALETIVVDNASGMAARRRFAISFQQAQVIELNENLGFAAGMNAGIHESAGDYVILLNSDVEALPGSLDALVEYMQANPDVGLVAPLLVDENERPRGPCLLGPPYGGLLPALGKLRYKQWRRQIGTRR